DLSLHGPKSAVLRGTADGRIHPGARRWSGPMRMMILLLASALAVFAADPRSGKAHVPVPERWGQTPPAEETTGSQILRTWWQSFHDPLLTSLVERALDSNLDLRLALARVAESRAARGLATSALLPSVGVSGSFSRLRGGLAQGLSRAGVLPGAPQSRTS